MGTTTEIIQGLLRKYFSDTASDDFMAGSRCQVECGESRLRLLSFRLKNSHFPSHFRRTQDRHVAGANVAGYKLFIVVLNLHVVFHLVKELDRKTFRRVKDEFQVMGAVYIMRLNAKFLLLPNGIDQLFSRYPNKSCVQQIGPIRL